MSSFPRPAPIDLEVSTKVTMDVGTAGGILALADWIRDHNIPIGAEFYFDHRNSNAGRFVWADKR